MLDWLRRLFSREAKESDLEEMWAEIEGLRSEIVIFENQIYGLIEDRLAPMTKRMKAKLTREEKELNTPSTYGQNKPRKSILSPQDLREMGYNGTFKQNQIGIGNSQEDRGRAG